jgi:hypothetical protein
MAVAGTVLVYCTYISYWLLGTGTALNMTNVDLFIAAPNAEKTQAWSLNILFPRQLIEPPTSHGQGGESAQPLSFACTSL